MGVAREYRDPELEGVRMWRITGFDSHVTSIVPLRAALRLSE
jgi:hypothetical protein